MASTITRRPLPALVALLALLLLTALVWWRVTNRDNPTATAKAKTCPTSSATVTAVAPRTLPPQRSVDVLVLNATTKKGLAAKARTALLADGFRSTLHAENDTAKNKPAGAAQIRYSADNRLGALLLQYYFPGAQLVQLPTASAQVTVSLGPKYTAVLPRKTVTAKLAANKIVLSTAAPTPTPSPSRSC